ncbi:hypothetical protein F2P81_000159 [Scophthalmus maximus]|uniref:Uncharacterized protein n=1 Tax=Scophthalmus maximus TaxID=52904 RepID=A0A6A4TG21_SCOMX|nr:hypothetical protein F2P81_000159 [Scophthalmus maximus]
MELYDSLKFTVTSMNTEAHWKTLAGTRMHKHREILDSRGYKEYVSRRLWALTHQEEKTAEGKHWSTHRFDKGERGHFKVLPFNPLPPNPPADRRLAVTWTISSRMLNITVSTVNVVELDSVPTVRLDVDYPQWTSVELQQQQQQQKSAAAH